MRLSPRLVTFAALTVVGIQPWLASAQEPVPATPGTAPQAVPARTARDVAQERRELAKRSLAILDNTLDRGAATASFIQEYYFWSVRHTGCEIFLSLPSDQPGTMVPEIYLASLKPLAGPEIQESLRHHLERMRALEIRYRRLEEQGILSPLDYQRILDHRIEAESWVLREQARRENQPSQNPKP